MKKKDSIMFTELPSFEETKCLNGSNHKYNFTLTCIKCSKYSPDVEYEKYEIRKKRALIRAAQKKVIIGDKEMNKEDNILKLKKALRDEKQRADTNYVAYDRVRVKYADLVLRMRYVRHSAARAREEFKLITEKLKILNDVPV